MTLDSVVTRLVRHGAVPGAVLGLSWPDGQRSVAAAGWSGDVRVRPDHRFLLTSLTKVLTATQIHLLAADGRLDLSAPVAELLPEFAAHGKGEVTPLQLLDHTSGLDSSTCNDAERADATSTPSQLYAGICGARLAFAPGTRVEYCSPAFWVLAELVRRLTGRSHADHLLASVVEPLGLSDTRYEPAQPAPERLVPPADRRHDGLADRVRRLAYPAGGVVSTANDLLAIGRIYLGEDSGLLSPVALRLLHTSATDGLPGLRSPSQGSSRTERSAGWALGGPGAFAHPQLLWHTGASGTSWWVDPQRRVVVVLLTASWYLQPRLLGDVLDATMALVDGAGTGSAP